MYTGIPSLHFPLLKIFVHRFQPWKHLYQEAGGSYELFSFPLKSFFTFSVINHLYSLQQRFLPAKRATLVCLASNGHLASPLISSPSYSKVFNYKRKINDWCHICSRYLFEGSTALFVFKFYLKESTFILLYHYRLKKKLLVYSRKDSTLTATEKKRKSIKKSLSYKTYLPYSIDTWDWMHWYHKQKPSHHFLEQILW